MKTNDNSENEINNTVHLTGIISSEASDKIKALQEQVAGLAAALENIARDESCGCRPVCKCFSESALRIWKEEAKSTAHEALKSAAPLLAKSRAVERVVEAARKTLDAWAKTAVRNTETREAMDELLAALAAIEAKKNTEGA